MSPNGIAKCNIQLVVSMILPSYPHSVILNFFLNLQLPVHWGIRPLPELEAEVSVFPSYRTATTFRWTIEVDSRFRHLDSVCKF